MPRIYEYIGPPELARGAQQNSASLRIDSIEDLESWICSCHATRGPNGTVWATFVITPDGALWLADRHSEHVQCAKGEPVLSAGEMAFERCGGDIEVLEVTNQSTGYCPEPESWPVVMTALDRIGVVRPDSFTSSMEFRLCQECGQVNLIKDNLLLCECCSARLPEIWERSE